MKNYNYRESIKADVLNWMEEHREELEGMDRADIEEFITDSCWVADEVTGNASGSYTFSRVQARDYFFSDLDSDDYISQMVQEGFLSEAEVGECITSSNWEKLDVCIRCYLLGEAVSEAMESIAD